MLQSRYLPFGLSKFGFIINPEFPFQWIEEVRSICGPQIPVLLVGCKADLRPSPGSPLSHNYVQTSTGQEVAREIGARAYKECSALRGEGVDDVFEAATRASMLMREGVDGHGGKARRKSSGEVDDEAAKGCCVLC